MFALKRTKLKKRAVLIVLTLAVIFATTVSAAVAENEFYEFSSCNIAEDEYGSAKTTLLYSINNQPETEYVARTLEDGSIYVDVVPLTDAKKESEAEYVPELQEDGSVHIRKVSDAAKVENIPALTKNIESKYNKKQQSRVEYSAGCVTYSPAESMTIRANELAAGKIYSMAASTLTVGKGSASAAAFKLNEGGAKMYYNLAWSALSRKANIRVGIIPKGGGVFIGTDVLAYSGVSTPNGILTFDVPEGEYEVIVINDSASAEDVAVYILRFFWLI